MFENKSYADEILNHPLNAQAHALNILEERLNGKLRVSDPNSPFCFLLEYGASIGNLIANKIEAGMRALYPKRAQTMDDLYKHMTDYDYLNMFSKPATVTLDLILNKDQLLLNAKDENEYYKRVDIPRQTIYTIGNIKFGMYYPITIRFIKKTNSVIVTYDNSVSNPLHTLTANMVETTTTSGTNTIYTVPNSEETFSGLSLLILRIPVYQFNFALIEEDLSTTIGFHKKYRYNDKFYAVRVFNVKGDTRTELSQTLSMSVYDYTKPTVYVKLDNDNNEFSLTIPHIYFNNGQLSGKLEIELYTTLGAIDIDLSTVPINAYHVDFGLKYKNISEYTSTLYRPVTLGIRLPQPKTLGGSNGFGFKELRDRVINNNFYKSVPISPTDIQKYFNDNGFRVIKSFDGVTDRTYTCFRELTDDNGSIIGTTVANVFLTKELIDNINTIYKNTNDSITILPTTLFRYNATTQQCIPLTNSEVLEFDQLNDELLIEKFNSNLYCYSPYHIHLQLQNEFPIAKTYNLINPKIDRFLFYKDNTNIASMMTAYAFSIVQKSIAGDQGYRVYFTVNKSEDIYDTKEEYTYIYVHTKTIEGGAPGIRAQLYNKTANYHVYYFDIDTNYGMDHNGRLLITNFIDEQVTEHYISLQPEFYITYMIHRSVYPEDTQLEQAPFDVISDIPSTLLENHIGLSRQKLIVNLGSDLSEIINNEINIAYTPKQYKTHEVDVPLVYDRTVYERDGNGNLIIDIVNGQPKLRVLHNAGDIVLDEFGEPIYRHRVGDIYYDENGNPIVIKSRSVIYNLSMMFLDAKLYISRHPDQINFIKKLPAQLESYLNTVMTIQNQLLERTNLFFKPISTMGIGKYGIGNDVVITSNLTISFKVKYYVRNSILTDYYVQDLIKTLTYKILESSMSHRIISITEIFENIRKELSDYIVKVDVLGINGDVELQTLIVLNEDTRPSIARKLTINKDNTIVLVPDIDIEFLAIELVD